MSMTIHVPTSHTSARLIAEITDALEKTGLSVETHYSPELDVELYSFHFVPEHGLELVWDMERALGESA